MTSVPLPFLEILLGARPSRHAGRCSQRFYHQSRCESLVLLQCVFAENRKLEVTGVMPPHSGCRPRCCLEIQVPVTELALQQATSPR